MTLTHWQRVGPELRYTNERAREMEENVAGFAKLVNADLYDLLKWAAELNGEIDRLREDYRDLLCAHPDEQYAALQEYLDSSDHGKRTIDAARAAIAETVASRESQA